MADGAPRRKRDPRDDKRVSAPPPRSAARPQGDATHAAVLVAFFVSGFAGLMHQVVWAKLLIQLIGATAHAQAAVLAVFMGGLAIGAVVLGRWVDRDGRPLRTYVWLEVAIGVYCLLLPLLLFAGGEGYRVVARLVFESAGLRLLLRAALAVLIVLAPAVLMGGTLPVLARRLVGRVEDTQRQVANLYALNSLGAVLGAGVAGFITLPALGVYGSLVLASLLNLAAGGLILPLARRETAPQAQPVPTPARRPVAAPVYSPAQYHATLAALALSGFAAMGYEVLFTRIIGLAFGSSTYSFTVMLMAFIAGIALGSAIIARRAVRHPLWWLAVSQVVVVVAFLAVTPLASRLPYLVGLVRISLRGAALGFELDLLAKAGLLLATLLLPTTCLGVMFPLVARVQARSPLEIGTRVGSTYAWNTLGNVLGVVTTSLVLIPLLGLAGAFHVTIAMNGAAALLLLLAAVEVAPVRRIVLAAAAAAAAALYVVAGTGWTDPIRYAVRHLRMMEGPDPRLGAAAAAKHPSSSFAAWRAEYVELPRDPARYYFGEDAHATVLALSEDDETYLNVNGKPDASSTGDMVTQLLLAHAPLLVVPEARSVLVIGYGSGVTAGAALRYPLERLDVAEISRAVVDADRLFADLNHNARSDPRLHLYEDDGQSFLNATPRTYDVVISEPSNPWIAGIGNLFTEEFFTTVRDHLSPHGVFTFWVHTYEQSDANVAMMVRTLDAVFPHALWFADDIFGNAIAVASQAPIEIDFDAMEQRYQRVRDDLARIDIPSFAAFLAYQRFTAEALRPVIGAGPVNTIGHPRLEYAAPRAMFGREVSHLLDRVDPLLRNRPADGTLLFDRYLAHRAAAGRPLTRADVDEAARYFEAFEQQSALVGAALRTRLDSPSAPAGQ